MPDTPDKPFILIQGFEAEENSEKDRAARTVNRRDGKYDGPVPNVSQAPQAVRSAGGRRRIGAVLARTRADRTLYSDKRDAFGPAIPVHRLRNISSTVATRAGIQSASPLRIASIVHDENTKFANDCFALRITNKRFSPAVDHRGRSLKHCLEATPRMGHAKKSFARRSFSHLQTGFLEASFKRTPE